mgnify:CR=1 FL=1
MNDILDLKPKKKEHVRIRPQMDEYALFDTLTARFFVINEIGYNVFSQCDGNKNVEEITEIIYDMCIEKPEKLEIQNDIIEMIDMLVKYNLIEVSA